MRPPFSQWIPTKLTSGPTFSAPASVSTQLQLEVTFDRTLSFSKPVSSLMAKFFPRLKALGCISASSWGPFKESLFCIKLFFGPLLTYASPGWFPFLSFQYHQIGTPLPRGQSRHHRLPVVLPYFTSL